MSSFHCSVTIKEYMTSYSSASPIEAMKMATAGQRMAVIDSDVRGGVHFQIK